MKKQIIKLLIRLGVLAKPVDNTVKLSIALTILKNNIVQCNTYEQLQACEKMFQWYVENYSTAPTMPAFKEEILLCIQVERSFIQTFSANEPIDHGNIV